MLMYSLFFFFFFSGQLLIFYTIFYAILGALFAICMKGLLATIDDKVPKWQQESSLIGTNPGLGFRPLPSRTEEGSLIWYNEQNKTTRMKWITLLDNFFNGNRTFLIKFYYNARFFDNINLNLSIFVFFFFRL